MQPVICISYGNTNKINAGSGVDLRVNEIDRSGDAQIIQIGNPDDYLAIFIY
jgi:hypothetical protein